MPKGHSALTLLFAATLFASAALLFWVEPMVGKMLLPVLGGTPAVWNTCLLFFQATLLVGYAYALAVSRWLTPGKQTAVQACLLALAALSLPVAISASALNSVPTESNPAFWLLGRLALVVGLPFFALAANSTLLQNWFSYSKSSRARDPYFLYAASNAGSLLGLIAYPAFLEPRFTLSRQRLMWAAGYCLVIIAVILCALLLREERDDNEARAVENDVKRKERLTLGRRLRWVALALVPSSLMLGATTYISTDVASIPLLWVTPLSLYLLTLVLAFLPKRPFGARLMIRTLPGVTMLLLLVYLSGATQPAWLLIIFHLLYLFAAALTCHTLLADERPGAEHLAEFYLCVSAGGALGGLFNALVAPAIFNSVLEYPLMILLACTLLPRGERREEGARARVLNLSLPVLIGLLTLGLVWVARRYALEYTQALALYLGVPLLLAYQLRQRPLAFTLSLALIAMASALSANTDSTVLTAERNFFGVLHVTRDERDTMHRLYNGITLHGSQSTDVSRRCEPLSYYTREGPLGQVFDAFQSKASARNVAVIGLGTGAILAYSRAGERWTFYEINPAVVRLARTPLYFTYLSACANAPMQIVLGDARLELARAQADTYGLIILDAFSSDAIPVHLMTEQALDLYLQKLAPGGILAFHLSNRSLDLHGVVADLALSRNLSCLARDDTSPSQTPGKEASEWVVLARRAEDFGALATDTRWHTLRGDLHDRVWTDDYSNIVNIFKWR